jgi:hypothetical protein
LIKGDVTTPPYEDYDEVQNFSMGFSRQAVGTPGGSDRDAEVPVWSGLTLGLRTGRSSPSYLAAVLNADEFDAHLALVDTSGGKSFTFAKWDFERLTFDAYSTSGGTGASPFISLNTYAPIIHYTYTPRGPDGKPQASITFDFDFSNNTITSSPAGLRLADVPLYLTAPTVVPEPAVAGLGLAFAGAMLLRRGRRD